MGKCCLPALHSHSTGVSCKSFSVDQFQFEKDELTGMLYLQLFWVHVLGFEFIIWCFTVIVFNLCCTWGVGCDLI